MTRRAIGVSERPPLLQTIPLSLQHLFAMFGATVLVPVLFHINPATVLLFNGIGTLLYLFICKGKIPAYLGSSFAFISPVLLLLPLGYEVALGGFIMCGVLFCLVSFIVKKAGTGWLDVLFPPAAMGAIVAVIGLELACAYAAFGTKITVVEALDHMLPMLDGDLTAVGVAHMKKMGIAFALECPVQSVETSPVGAKVVCTTKSGDTVTFEAEKVLVAIGRKANTASLDLEAGGIRNDRGRILVNDRMQTNVPGVYAIGDCVFGKAQLAHTASAMGEVAAENIMGHDSTYDESTNPTCVYMEPEAASVGLTEEQCKAKGLDYKVGKFPMSANGKALIINGGEGLVKIISDAKYGEVLGMHIIGPRATDLISEGALAIRLEATVDELISTIHSHPTVTETIREAALNAMGRAIHTKN